MNISLVYLHNELMNVLIHQEYMKSSNILNFIYTALSMWQKHVITV